jgi:hypothetical protein
MPNPRYPIPKSRIEAYFAPKNTINISYNLKLRYNELKGTLLTPSLKNRKVGIVLCHSRAARRSLSYKEPSGTCFCFNLCRLGGPVHVSGLPVITVRNQGVSKQCRWVKPPTSSDTNLHSAKLKTYQKCFFLCCTGGTRG